MFIVNCHSPIKRKEITLNAKRNGDRASIRGEEKLAKNYYRIGKNSEHLRLSNWVIQH